MADSRSVVEGFLEAFVADDSDKMLSFCAPNIRSIDYSTLASGIRGDYRGPDGFAQQMERFDAALEATSFEVNELIGEGDTFVARTTLGLKSKGTNETYEGPLLIVLEVEDGKIALMETFPTEPETLYPAT